MGFGASWGKLYLSVMGEGTVEKVRRIPLDKLAFCEGLIAEDVMSSDRQVCLLPKGTDLSLDVVRSSLPALVRQLRRRGVEYLLVSKEEEYSLDELRRVVERLQLPFSQELDRSLARHAVTQVGSVYERIAMDAMVPEDFGVLVDAGKVLAQEVQKVPQILLSLSELHSLDEYTFVHSLNVSLLAGFIAKRMAPEDQELIEVITIGGLLHDLGKSRISLDILNKPGRLSEEEFQKIQVHPLEGETLARYARIEDPRILGFIRSHHERWGGEGYPDKIQGDEIPLVARIGAVADVFDALTTKRVYKDAYHNARALQVIIENAGSHFDRSVVRCLLSSVGLYPPGSVVELSDGSVGVVVGNRVRDLFRPQVLLQTDPLGVPYQEPLIVDLYDDNVELFVKKVLGSARKRSLQEPVVS